MAYKYVQEGWSVMINTLSATSESSFEVYLVSTTHENDPYFTSG